MAAGIPVIGAVPCPNYRRPGVPLCRRRGHRNGRVELHFARDWATRTAAESVKSLDWFKPGETALLMVCGHGIDAVDVDVKDGMGGSVEHLGPFARYGMTRTPSGGEHYPVPGSWIATEHGWETDAGFIGDYQGGTAAGESRGLLFLPGSSRPKYPGLEYVEEEPWDLDALLAGSPDEVVLAALGRAKAAPRRPEKAWVDGEATEAEKAKAAAVLASKAAELAAIKQGKGRTPKLWGALKLLYRFCLAGALDDVEVDRVMWAAVQAQPDTHGDHDEVFAAKAEQAWAAAEKEGPTRPETDDDESEFDVVTEDVCDACDTLGVPCDEHAVVACPVPKSKSKREDVDMSWLPGCGLHAEEVQVGAPDAMGHAWANLLAWGNLSCDVPFVYRNGSGKLLYAGHNDKTGDVHITEITVPVLAAMLGAVGYVRVYDGRQKKKVKRYTPPPSVVTQVATLLPTHPNIPELRELVCSPVLLADGTWADTDGWADGQLIRLRRDVGYRTVPRGGGPADVVKDAAEVIRDAYREVKFSTDAGLGTMVGRSVGLVARSVCPKVPHVLVGSGATNQGTGKNIAVDIADACAVHVSERQIILLANLQEAEVEKRIDTAMKDPRRAKVLANLPYGVVLDSSALTEMLTSPPDRALDLRDYGNNKSASVVFNTGSWSTTGNGPQPSKDIGARTVRNWLDANIADTRDLKWKRKDIDGWLRAHHEELNYALRVLVSAALARLRVEVGYRAAVEKRVAGMVRGDYLEWSVLTCAVVDLLDVEGFGKDQQQWRDDYTEVEDTGPLDKVLAAMVSLGATELRPVTAAAVRETGLLGALFTDNRELGEWMRKNRDAWGKVDGVPYKLKPQGQNRKGVLLWAVVRGKAA